MSSIKKIKKNIKVDQEKSSGLSAFIERPMPTEQEVKNFERVVEKEARHQEIDSNLSEIYKDSKGDLIDVKQVSAKKKTNIFVRIFKKLLFFTLLFLAAYFSYLYFFSGDSDMNSFKFQIIAPEKIVAGEEFSYFVEYSNPTKFGATNLKLELKYPEGFIYSSANLEPSTGSYGFNLPDLAPGATGKLEVKGRIVNKLDSVNIISGRLIYTPAGISSEFKKESSDATIISGISFQVGLESSNLAFINQDNEVSLSFYDVEENFLEDFIIRFVLPEQTTITAAEIKLEEGIVKEDKQEDKLITADSEYTGLALVSEGTETWLLRNLRPDTAGKKINFKYQVKEQPSSAEIIIRLEKRLADGQSYTFWEKRLIPEFVKSDLNLTLFLDGSNNNSPVNFGDTLNYTLNYSNKGENTFKDASISFVLDGFFYDWNSLKLETPGEIRMGKMIIWTKKELPALAEIRPGESGEINIMINIKDYQTNNFGEKLEVIAYAQSGTNAGESTTETNKSNEIVSKINSDLNLIEKVRYFDDNNLPVGSGPLPPRVGEVSNFRVDWLVENSLHELSQTEVSVQLPDYVYYNENSFTSVGNLTYDGNQRKVIWNIGRLPISVSEVNAHFSLAITPSEADRNKILVLSPGATIIAVDNETQEEITKKSGPKTTKLEDDDIAGLSSSGRIE